VIWHLFKNFIDASNTLELNDAFLQSEVQSQQKLAKPKIASDGQLRKWRLL
jgi:alpha-L-fucosidase 2